VFRELCERGALSSGSTILEVGCGTGNYARALVARFGCAACGIDPSEGMLARACARSEGIPWLLGRAEQLAFAGGTFDLVFSVDVIHHVADKPAFYREAARVLRPSGRLCTATDSAEIIRRREILSSYFPETVEKELARYPRLAQLEAWMLEADLGGPSTGLRAGPSTGLRAGPSTGLRAGPSTGLRAGLEVVTVEAPYEIASAQPFRDKAYSALHLISEDAWQAGLERLERDLARGPVRGVSRYACVWGQRV
jgi:SAM-dependent methyltransferase